MKEGRTFPDLLRRYLPILTWGAEYSPRTLASDLVAAAIVSIMLIPQSLAYALMVGLPPQVGLYASMAPLALYAIFGTSRALAVGPVAVASLMTAAAAGQVAAQGTPEHLGAAIALAMVAGILLIAMGVLRLGFLANFLSHPVISGFITAAAVQISAGQVGPLLGIRSKGENLLDILQSIVPSLSQINPYTAAIGLASLVFLLWARRGLKPLLLRVGIGERPADILAKVGPAMTIVATTAAVWGFGLDARGVGILGVVPQGLPSLALPPFDAGLWTTLARPRAADLHRRLCGVDLGRPDARRQAPPARRSRPGTDRAGGFRYRRGRLGRLPGRRRALAFGRELRRRRPDPRRGRVHRGRRRARHAVSHAAAVLPAESGPWRHHHRRRSFPWWTSARSNAPRPIPRPISRRWPERSF